MQRKKSSYIFVPILTVLAVVIIAAVTDSGSAPETTMQLGYDYPVAAELSEMIEASEVIVVGKYGKLESTWNMARNPNNIMEEDPNNYTEGHLYRFTAESVLKGELDNLEILVNHRYAERHTFIKSNAEVNQAGEVTKQATRAEEVSFSVQDPLYIEPQIDDTYILFLKRDGVFGNYYGAVEPFSIRILADHSVRLQSNLISGAGAFEETVVAENGQQINVRIKGASLEDMVSDRSFESIIAEITNQSMN